MTRTAQGSAVAARPRGVAARGFGEGREPGCCRANLGCGGRVTFGVRRGVGGGVDACPGG